ncbi:metal-dependent hydrolase [Ectothiorhodospira mobilis]|uniref:LexA-binding, inner membrane-associated putative hydrolase n=1 Tax=Ectothiorhodospira mobilis TaxID=195064 RepID=A0A1I4T0S6_ECTMO|nr:metal-dependent hydrolase [Ectothiorhodospira mobilis]MCG5536372.1 metal-dependent hydrolase [Ectothiorhodospira mobilis]SFM70259.1 LexA-binding, inner membrane-associated putative hydrolase [Ectothiorhodospira mobilis]
MANFATHVSVAGVVGGALAGAVAGTGHLQGAGAPLAWAGLFTAGTLLPDIDVDGGRAQRWLFSGLAFAAFLLVLLPVIPVTGVSWRQWLEAGGCERILLAAGVWLLVRFPLAWGFQRATRHRGLCHSLVVGLLWGLGWIYLALTCLHMTAEAAWLQGAAIFLGFILHLILDEISSVDLDNARVKRSFGSALKIWAPDQPLASLAATLAVILLLWALPLPWGWLAR